MDNVDVEARFTAKLRAAFAAGEYDAFMDFTMGRVLMVLYATSLAPYAASFQRDRVPFLALRWADDRGAVWHSLIVQVSTSQLVLELVSAG
eukprot:gene30414-23839_t